MSVFGIENFTSMTPRSFFQFHTHFTDVRFATSLTKKWHRWHKRFGKSSLALDKEQFAVLHEDGIFFAKVQKVQKGSPAHLFTLDSDGGPRWRLGLRLGQNLVWKKTFLLFSLDWTAVSRHLKKGKDAKWKWALSVAAPTFCYVTVDKAAPVDIE